MNNCSDQIEDPAIFYVFTRNVQPSLRCAGISHDCVLNGTPDTVVKLTAVARIEISKATSSELITLNAYG